MDVPRLWFVSYCPLRTLSLYVASFFHLNISWELGQGYDDDDDCVLMVEVL